MNNITVRPLQSSDKADVECICITTAPPELCKNENMREYTLNMYNRYYTRVVSHSFVAVNSQDKPIGYILCAPDYNLYKKDFFRNELKEIRKLGIGKYLFSRSEVLFYKKYSKEYPAHLHIDILPEYQGMHIGTNLMNTLLEYLKDKGVKGLMLSVAPQNKGAIAFYESCGFNVLSKRPALVYGIRF